MVLELLIEKKHFLNEFYKINLKGLTQFENNDFDNVELFYNSREKLLEIIQYIDQKTDELSPKIAVATVNSDGSKMIAFIQLEIKALAQEILKQDMQILSLMDQEKSSIIKELQSIGKNKKHFGSYKTKTHRKIAIDEEV